MGNLQTNQPTPVALILKYARLWPLLLASLVLSLGLGFLYLQTQVPKYKITSTLLLQDDSKGDGLFKGTAFSDLTLFGTRKTVYDEMERIRSRDLIYNVLKQLNLQTRYAYQDLLRDRELYGTELPVVVETIVLKPAAYTLRMSVTPVDADNFVLTEKAARTTYRYGKLIRRPEFIMIVRRGPAPALEGKPVLISFVDLYKRAQAYSSAGLVVMPVIKDANTVSLTMLDEIPERGVAFLNTLLLQYNNENVNSKNRTAVQTINFINTKLKALSATLSGAERDIEDYKVKNRITELREDAQINLQNSGQSTQQWSAINMQLNLVNSLYGYLTTGKDKFELVPTTMGLKDPTLQNLTDKYNNLQIERQRLLRNNSAVNPLVMTLTEQLALLRANMLENLKMVKKGLLLERSNYSNQTSKSDNRLSSVPVMERGLLERSREQGVKTTQYQYLLQKKEETELSLSATIPSFEVVESPGYNPAPASPKVQLVYLLSLLTGLSLPVGIVFLKEITNSKVREAADAVYITNKGNILGELSHKGLREAIVVEKGKSTNISELFRYIRTNLQFMDVDNLNKVMLVTSTSKGEGKTFFSINLGITLSLIGKKVVVLEFDLRKPDLLRQMNIKSSKGLSNYLSGEEIGLDELLVPAPSAENLYVIGCGTLPDNPAELLSSERLGGLIEQLKAQFDYVIIDSSPVGHVADAFSLGQFVDVSIYLVRYNYTTKSDLSIFTEICESRRLKNPMIVFNDARKDNRNLYRYGRYAYN